MDLETVAVLAERLLTTFQGVTISVVEDIPSLPLLLSTLQVNIRYQGIVWLYLLQLFRSLSCPNLRHFQLNLSGNDQDNTTEMAHKLDEVLQDDLYSFEADEGRIMAEMGMPPHFPEGSSCKISTLIGTAIQLQYWSWNW